MATIVALYVKDVKRIKEVQLRPKDDGLVVIQGRNAQGKSSVLDAIAMALGGERLCPPEVIRRGQKTGEVAVELNDGTTVVRRWTEKGTTLSVKNPKSGKVANPQTFLSSLVGTLAFDPLGFCRMKPKDQADVLLRIAGVDLAPLSARYAAAYDARTEAGRAVRAAQANLDAIKRPGDGPEEETSMVSLLAERDAIDAAKRARRKLEEQAQTDRVAAKTAADLVADLERRLEAARASLSMAMDASAKSSLALSEAPEPGSTDDVNERIAGLERSNADARMRARHRQAQEALDRAAEQQGLAGDQVDAAVAAKAAAVKAAVLPVEGLTVDEDGIYFGGIPFQQASQAEQIRVSVAVGLATQPEIRVILVRDGSLLDEDGLEMLRATAEQFDAQVWIERVGTEDADGITIVDGEVQEG